jgi:hypothetical protein
MTLKQEEPVWTSTETLQSFEPLAYKVRCVDEYEFPSSSNFGVVLCCAARTEILLQSSGGRRA